MVKNIGLGISVLRKWVIFAIVYLKIVSSQTSQPQCALTSYVSCTLNSTSVVSAQPNEWTAITSQDFSLPAYLPNTKCRLNITSPPGYVIRITFVEFNTERGADVVRFFDTATSYVMLASLNGTPTVPTQFYSTFSNRAQLQFNTNSFGQFSGWKGFITAVLQTPRISTTKKPAITSRRATKKSTTRMPTTKLATKRLTTRQPTVKGTTRKPVTSRRTTRKPSSRKPTTRKPTTRRKTTRKPTTHEPTTRKPTTRRKTTRKPTTHKPTTKKQTTRKPTTRKPTTPIRTTRKPTTRKKTPKPTTRKPTTLKSTTRKSTTRKLTTRKPTTRKPTTRRRTTRGPTTGRPTTRHPTTRHSTVLTSGQLPTNTPTLNPATQVPSTAASFSSDFNVTILRNATQPRFNFTIGNFLDLSRLTEVTFAFFYRVATVPSSIRTILDVHTPTSSPTYSIYPFLQVDAFGSIWIGSINLGYPGLRCPDYVVSGAWSYLAVTIRPGQTLCYQAVLNGSVSVLSVSDLEFGQIAFAPTDRIYLGGDYNSYGFVPVDADVGYFSLFSSVLTTTKLVEYANLGMSSLFKHSQNHGPFNHTFNFRMPFNGSILVDRPQNLQGPIGTGLDLSRSQNVTFAMFLNITALETGIIFDVHSPISGSTPYAKFQPRALLLETGLIWVYISNTLTHSLGIPCGKRIQPGMWYFLGISLSSNVMTCYLQKISPVADPVMQITQETVQLVPFLNSDSIFLGGGFNVDNFGFVGGLVASFAFWPFSLNASGIGEYRNMMKARFSPTLVSGILNPADQIEPLSTANKLATGPVLPDYDLIMGPSLNLSASRNFTLAMFMNISLQIDSVILEIRSPNSTFTALQITNASIAVVVKEPDGRLLSSLPCPLKVSTQRMIFIGVTWTANQIVCYQQIVDQYPIQPLASVAYAVMTAPFNPQNKIYLGVMSNNSSFTALPMKGCILSFSYWAFAVSGWQLDAYRYYQQQFLLSDWLPKKVQFQPTPWPQFETDFPPPGIPLVTAPATPSLYFLLGSGQVSMSSSSNFTFAFFANITTALNRSILLKVQTPGNFYAYPVVELDSSSRLMLSSYGSGGDVEFLLTCPLPVAINSWIFAAFTVAGRFAKCYQQTVFFNSFTPLIEAHALIDPHAILNTDQIYLGGADNASIPLSCRVAYMEFWSTQLSLGQLQTYRLMYQNLVSGPPIMYSQAPSSPHFQSSAPISTPNPFPAGVSLILSPTKPHYNFSVANSDLITTSSNFAFAMFVNVTSLQTSAVVFEVLSPNTIGYFPALTVSSSGRMKFQSVDNEGNPNLSLLCPLKVPLNSWVFVALTVSGFTATCYQQIISQNAIGPIYVSSVEFSPQQMDLNDCIYAGGFNGVGLPSLIGWVSDFTYCNIIGPNWLASYTASPTASPSVSLTALPSLAPVNITSMGSHSSPSQPITSALHLNLSSQGTTRNATSSITVTSQLTLIPNSTVPIMRSTSVSKSSQKNSVTLHPSTTQQVKEPATTTQPHIKSTSQSRTTSRLQSTLKLTTVYQKTTVSSSSALPVQSTVRTTKLAKTSKFQTTTKPQIMQSTTAVAHVTTTRLAKSTSFPSTVGFKTTKSATKIATTKFPSTTTAITPALTPAPMTYSPGYLLVSNATHPSYDLIVGDGVFNMTASEDFSFALFVKIDSLDFIDTVFKVQTPNTPNGDYYPALLVSSGDANFKLTFKSVDYNGDVGLSLDCPLEVEANNWAFVALTISETSAICYQQETSKNPYSGLSVSSFSFTPHISRATDKVYLGGADDGLSGLPLAGNAAYFTYWPSSLVNWQLQNYLLANIGNILGPNWPQYYTNSSAPSHAPTTIKVTSSLVKGTTTKSSVIPQATSHSTATQSTKHRTTAVTQKTSKLVTSVSITSPYSNSKPTTKAIAESPNPTTKVPTIKQGTTLPITTQATMHSTSRFSAISSHSAFKSTSQLQSPAQQFTTKTVKTSTAVEVTTKVKATNTAKQSTTRANVATSLKMGTISVLTATKKNSTALTLKATTREFMPSNNSVFSTTKKSSLVATTETFANPVSFPTPFMLVSTPVTPNFDMVVGSSVNVSHSANFTFALFVKLFSVTLSNTIFKVQTPFAPGNTYYPSLAVTTSGVPLFRSLNSDGNLDLSLSCPISVDVNSWIFIAFTVSGNRATCYAQSISNHPVDPLLSSTVTFTPHGFQDSDRIFLGQVNVDDGTSVANGIVTFFSYWPFTLNLWQVYNYRYVYQTALLGPGWLGEYLSLALPPPTPTPSPTTTSTFSSTSSVSNSTSPPFTPPFVPGQNLVSNPIAPALGLVVGNGIDLSSSANFSFGLFVNVSSVDLMDVVFRVQTPSGPNQDLFPSLQVSKDTGNSLFFRPNTNATLYLQCPLDVPLNLWVYVVLTISGNIATCYQQILGGNSTGPVASSSLYFQPKMPRNTSMIFLGGANDNLYTVPMTGLVAYFTYWPATLPLWQVYSYRNQHILDLLGQASTMTVFPSVSPKFTTSLKPTSSANSSFVKATTQIGSTTSHGLPPNSTIKISHTILPSNSTTARTFQVTPKSTTAKKATSPLLTTKSSAITTSKLSTKLVTSVSKTTSKVTFMSTTAKATLHPNGTFVNSTVTQTVSKQSTTKIQTSGIASTAPVATQPPNSTIAMTFQVTPKSTTATTATSPLLTTKSSATTTSKLSTKLATSLSKTTSKLTFMSTTAKATLHPNGTAQNSTVTQSLSKQSTTRIQTTAIASTTPAATPAPTPAPITYSPGYLLVSNAAQPAYDLTVSDGIVNVTTSEDFTFALFLKVQSVDFFDTVFKVQTPNTPEGEYYPALLVSAGILNYKLTFKSVDSNGSANLDLDCPLQLQANNWTFVAMTVSGSTATCYQQLTSQSPYSGFITSSVSFTPNLPRSTDLVYLGGANDGTGGQPMDGVVSYFTYWPSSLAYWQNWNYLWSHIDDVLGPNWWQYYTNPPPTANPQPPSPSLQTTSPFTTLSPQKTTKRSATTSPTRGGWTTTKSMTGHQTTLQPSAVKTTTAIAATSKVKTTAQPATTLSTTTILAFNSTKRLTTPQTSVKQISTTTSSSDLSTLHLSPSKSSTTHRLATTSFSMMPSMSTLTYTLGNLLVANVAQPAYDLIVGDGVVNMTANQNFSFALFVKVDSIDFIDTIFKVQTPNTPEGDYYPALLVSAGITHFKLTFKSKDYSGNVDLELDCPLEVLASDWSFVALTISGTTAICYQQLTSQNPYSPLTISSLSFASHLSRSTDKVYLGGADDGSNGLPLSGDVNYFTYWPSSLAYGQHWNYLWSHIGNVLGSNWTHYYTSPPASTVAPTFFQHITTGPLTSSSTAMPTVKATVGTAKLVTQGQYSTTKTDFAHTTTTKLRISSAKMSNPVNSTTKRLTQIPTTKSVILSSTSRAATGMPTTKRTSTKYSTSTSQNNQTLTTRKPTTRHILTTKHETSKRGSTKRMSTTAKTSGKLLFTTLTLNSTTNFTRHSTSKLATQNWFTNRVTSKNPTTKQSTTRKLTTKNPTISQHTAQSSITTKKQTTKKQTTKNPTANKSTSREFTTRKRSTKKLTTKLSTKKPTTKSPTTKKRTTKKSTTKKLTTKKPTTKKLTTKKPTTRKLTTKKPIIMKSTTKRLTTKKETTKKPKTTMPITRKVTTKTISTTKPTTKRTRTSKPILKESTSRILTTKKSTVKKLTTRKPTTKQPTTKKATVKKSTINKGTVLKKTTSIHRTAASTNLPRCPFVPYETCANKTMQVRAIRNEWLGLKSHLDGIMLQPGLSCRLNLTADPTDYVRIIFVDFAVNDLLDSVVLNEGDLTRSEIRLSTVNASTRIPTPYIQSNGSSIFLQFSSRLSDQSPIWEALYQAVQKPVVKQSTNIKRTTTRLRKKTTTAKNRATTIKKKPTTAKKRTTTAKAKRRTTTKMRTTTAKARKRTSTAKKRTTTATKHNFPSSGSSPVPKLALFAWTAISVDVTFMTFTKNVITDAKTCSMFSLNTLKGLGSSIFCNSTGTVNGTSNRISVWNISPTSTLKPGDLISVYNKSIALSAPTSLPAPVAVITGPVNPVRYCDEVVLSGASSFTKDLRPLQYTWTNSLSKTTSKASSITFSRLTPNSFISATLAATSFFQVRSRTVTWNITVESATPKVKIGGDAIKIIRAADSIILEAVATASTCETSLSYQWAPVSGVAFTGVTLNSRTLTLPGFLLQAGKNYTFHVTASTKSLTQAYSSSALTVVSVKASNLLVVISGSGQYTSGGTVIIDASHSNDPDYPGSQNLLFLWRCSGNPCLGFTYAPETGLNSPSLKFNAPDVSEPVTVTFSVSITSKNGSPRKASGSSTIQIRPKSENKIYPTVTIAPLRVPKVDPTSSVLLIATPQSFMAPSVVPAVTWTCVSDPSYPMDSSTLLTSSVNPILKFRPNVLQGSKTYTFEVKAIDPTDGKLTATASIDVPVNSAPFGGLVSVSPTSGNPLITNFAFTTSGWADEDTPLSYLWSYFDPSSQQEILLGGGVATSSNEMATVLPAGDAQSGNLTVFVRALDYYGAISASVSAVVTVQPIKAAQIATFFTNFVNGSLGDALQGADTSKATDLISMGATMLNSAHTNDTAASTQIRASLVNALVAVVGKSTGSDRQLTATEVNCQTQTLQAITAAPEALSTSTASTAINLISGILKSSSPISTTAQTALAQSTSSVMEALLGPVTTSTTSAGAPAAAPAANLKAVGDNVRNIISSIATAALNTMQPGEAPQVLVTKQFVSESVKVAKGAPIISASVEIPSTALASVGGPVGLQSTSWATNLYAYTNQTICGKVQTVNVVNSAGHKIKLSGLIDPLAVAVGACVTSDRKSQASTTTIMPSSQVTSSSGNASLSPCPGLWQNGTVFVPCNGQGSCLAMNGTYSCVCHPGFQGPSCGLQVVCSWFDSVNQTWTQSGCTRSVSAATGLVSCHCDHATDFTAQLTPFVPKPVIPDEKAFVEVLTGQNINMNVVAVISSILGVTLMGIIWGRYQDVKVMETRRRAMVKNADFQFGIGSSILYLRLNELEGLLGTAVKITLQIGAMSHSLVVTKKLYGSAKPNQVVPFELSLKHVEGEERIVVTAEGVVDSNLDISANVAKRLQTTAKFYIPLDYLVDGELHSGRVASSADSSCSLAMDAALGNELKPIKPMSIFERLFEYWKFNHTIVSSLVFHDCMSLSRPQRIVVLSWSILCNMMLSALFTRFKETTWQQKVGVGICTAAIQLPASTMMTYFFFIHFKKMSIIERRWAFEQGIDLLAPEITFNRFRKGLTFSLPLVKKKPLNEQLTSTTNSRLKIHPSNEIATAWSLTAHRASQSQSLPIVIADFPQFDVTARPPDGSSDQNPAGSASGAEPPSNSAGSDAIKQLAPSASSTKNRSFAKNRLYMAIETTESNRFQKAEVVSFPAQPKQDSTEAGKQAAAHPALKNSPKLTSSPTASKAPQQGTSSGLVADVTERIKNTFSLSRQGSLSNLQSKQPSSGNLSTPYPALQVVPTHGTLSRMSSIKEIPATENTVQVEATKTTLSRQNSSAIWVKGQGKTKPYQIQNPEAKLSRLKQMRYESMNEKEKSSWRRLVDRIDHIRNAIPAERQMGVQYVSCSPVLIAAYSVIAVLVVGVSLMLLAYGAYFDQQTCNDWLSFSLLGIAQNFGVFENLPLVKALRATSS